MKKPVFTGSGVAIVTPFDGESIDYNAFERLIEFQIANKTDAIVVCGTTGEASTLSDEEHRQAIEFAIRTVAGRVPVVAGTGSNDTKYCLELSRFACSAGADALLLVTPYYNKTSQHGLVKHFSYIADRVDKPIILYNVPSRTGMTISLEAYKELARHENIVATKEASSDITHIARVAAECGDDLFIYSGNDDQIVPILSLGGIGVISVLANIMPLETHNICQMFFDGDVAGSRSLQLRLLEFITNLFIEVNPVPIKTAMNLAGLSAGPVRMPLFPMSEKNLEKLRDSMIKLGLITA